MSKNEFRYFVIYKPYRMLSQFKKDGKLPLLGELFNFPKDVYPVGRLDSDSEGLLILTNDKRLNYLLLDPSHKHERTYLVQVEGIVSNEALHILEKGVGISVEGKPHHTKPAKAEKCTEPGWLPARFPPVRFRKEKPTSFLKLTLYEGKNRQVRRMTAAVGFPTLRLVRISIENLRIGNMQPGEVIEFRRNELYKLLKISAY